MTRLLFTWEPKIEQKTVIDRIYAVSFGFIQRKLSDLMGIIKCVVGEDGYDSVKKFWYAINIAVDRLSLIELSDDIKSHGGLEEVKKALNELETLLRKFREYLALEEIYK
jgi:hypothetical protein